MPNDLYQAILARRSVRRYDRQPLDASILAQVRDIIADVKPLVPDNLFEAPIKDVQPGADLASILGGYGHIVSPPHYLVPHISGQVHLLADLGYRAEQIAVRLTALGLGTCFVASLKKEASVLSHFELPQGARIGAFLAFGWPAEGVSGRLFNTLMRTAAGATRKLPAGRIFFQESFDSSAEPPSDLAPLIEAARHAPSAYNAQPWRFLWHGGRLYLFVTRRNPRYGSGAGAQYRLYDGGICLANVALALEALGIEGNWQMLTQDAADLPDHPAHLEPLAVLVNAR